MGASRRKRWGRYAWVAGGGLVLSLSCGSIRNDELQCEEAVARLEDCCPGFEPARFDCQYVDTNCTGNPRRPVVSESAAECIRDLECSELVSSGKCERLIAIAKVPYPTATEIAEEACK